MNLLKIKEAVARENIKEFIPSAKIKELAASTEIPDKEVIKYLLELGIWPERFRRNKGVLSTTNQQTLLDLNVFIAGCGGLGGYIANLLVRSGVGGFIVCDPDTFEESNLNRQLYCSEKTLGMYKAEVLRDNLVAIASYVDIKYYIEKCTDANLSELTQGADLIIDCLDSVEGKEMLEAAALRLKLPFLHGAVLEQEGIVYFDIPATSRLNALYPQKDSTHTIPKVLCSTVCATASLMGSLLLNTLLFSKQEHTPIYHLDCSIQEIEQFYQ